MKTLIGLSLALLGLGTASFASPETSAPSTLRVVATIPDIGDIVTRIGGPLVSVTTLTKGNENLHAVTARPSQIVALSRAQMFVQVGLSLESSFAPGLLERARNQAIQPGQPGFVNLSEGWSALDVPTDLSRKGGDLHPQGNPHLNLDPRGGRHMAEGVLAALIRLAPESKADFESRFAEYDRELTEAEQRWAKASKAFANQKVAVYHQEYVYVTRLYGIEISDSIELRPGVPATPGHLTEVIAHMQAENVRVILVSPWSDNREVKRVSELTGARVVVLPNQVGGSSETQTWIAMMDFIHDSLTKAFGAEQ